jgi:anthranilate phosphoribosyltransferase
VVADAQQSLALIRQAFSGQAGAALDMLLFNAGAAIYTADLAADLATGIEAARQAISSGAAQEKLDQLVALSQGFNQA